MIWTRWPMKPDSRNTTKAPQKEEPSRNQKVDDPFLRAPNEDDDGYDPYSDRTEQPDLYEEDPWR